jgi:predicted RNase H-like nuclease (RuvC/YqgF family)
MRWVIPTLRVTLNLIIFGIITQQNIMEKSMSALQKLQEKIEQWRVDHEALKSENAQLKVELENASGSQYEKDTAIETLKRELEEKDAEIEKIIAQVESLLS